MHCCGCLPKHLPHPIAQTGEGSPFIILPSGPIESLFERWQRGSFTDSPNCPCLWKDLCQLALSKLSQSSTEGLHLMSCIPVSCFAFPKQSLEGPVSNREGARHPHPPYGCSLLCISTLLTFNKYCKGFYIRMV